MLARLEVVYLLEVYQLLQRKVYHQRSLMVYHEQDLRMWMPAACTKVQRERRGPSDLSNEEDLHQGRKPRFRARGLDLPQVP